MDAISLAEARLNLPNGLNCAYWDSGRSRRADGRTIVLLHGFCGSSAYWENMPALLEGAGRLIIPDLRGHGRSSAPGDPTYTMEQLADDVCELLDALEVDRAIVIGHSLGGYTALAFAERHADRLAGLGLVHSTPLPDDETGKANRLKTAESILAGGLREVVDGLAPKLFAPRHLETMAEAVQRVKEIGYRASAHGAAAVTRGMRERPDRRAVLERTGVPVLLVAGAEDGIVPPEKVFAAHGPDTEKRIIQNCGHMGMIESPAEVAQAIHSFVENV
ncbi:alpha/beta hydrolase [Paenibacillus cisolokensis]|jgi:pimeloyl-ACP methyl ester carboxylesterase|uniref:Alpha/beta hydrolase n=1 Tax=Paenibacillus cisolokensis TaxID=1658519 RepID=A0ABQ4N0V1_9BACL|nr:MULTISPECIES: alpha/beta hydrolase [Paenibacillus]ALS26532.1 alpha/beta hydrolase [Paenibacillus sp. 32O-W]GIQ61806.1 alpha/beta hydrolase [Paenibacillus cisolokensis]